MIKSLKEVSDDEFNLTTISPDTLKQFSGEELKKILDKFIMLLSLHEEQGQELPEGLNLEEFKNRMIFVEEELKRRESNPHAIDEVKIKTLVDGLPDEILLHEDFTRFGGSFFESDDGEEVRAFIKDGFPDSPRDVKLFRLLKKLTGKDVEFSLCPQGFPKEAMLEGYDIILRKSPTNDLNIINEKDFQKRIYASQVKISSDIKERISMVTNSLVDFVSVPSFVSVSGSFIYHSPGRLPNDIDVFVKSMEESSEVVESLFEKISDLAGIKPQFVWESRGPNWTHFPIYDLVFKVRSSKNVNEGNEEIKEIVLKSGLHSHPHEINGSHDHPGLTQDTGSHAHIPTGQLTGALGGGHVHREGDPLEGFHLNLPGEDGSHEHINARSKDNLELKKWMNAVVDAHHPKHLWLPGHVKTFIQHIGRDSEPFEATRKNWVDHFQWMHSSGMHQFRHDKIFIDPETIFIRKWYEFEDGTKRMATKKDFQLEEKYFNENLPLPGF